MAFKIGDVRNALRLNTNWLIASVLGLDVLTDADKEELKKKGRLPTKSLNLVERSYVLGKLKSLLTKSEYGKIDYQDLVDKANETSESEKKVVEQLKAKAIANFQRVVNKVEETVLDKLQTDEAYKEVVDSLESSLSDIFENGWKLAVETEIHAAQTQGIAQTILHKKGPYKGGGGPDARVSVVPKPTACPDCKIQYLDGSGNPRIFLLSELISNGTNVHAKHSKTKGVHTFWRATLPPLHPRCRCDLQYIPDGASWIDGKLVMPGGLTKAIGESALSPVRKPLGADANKSAPDNMKPPTMAGVKSPNQGSNSAGGASAAAKPGSAGGGGGNNDYEPCSVGGGQACQEAGGPPGGADTHETGGSVAQAHLDYQSKHQQKSSNMAESMAHTADQQESSLAAANPHAKILKDLSTGHISTSKPLDAGSKGATEAFKVYIDGMGEALVKPPAYSNNNMINMGFAPATGAHTCPSGTGHTREKAYFQGAMMLGLTSHVPPTELRTFEGKPASAQKWLNGYSSAGKTLALVGGFTNYAQGLLDSCPTDKVDKLRNKMHECIVMTALFNHNDQHLDNIMVSDDFSDIQCIDNTSSYGTGLEGMSNEMFEQMHKGGLKVSVPDHLQKKLKNTTLADIKRGHGNSIEDWAAGQTYLRMKYVMFLQERDGELDYEKFRSGTFGNGMGNMVSPHPGYWDDIQYKKGPNGAVLRDVHGEMIPEKGMFGEFTSPEYTRRKDKNLSANQMFESFAKQWLEDAKALPENHPDRISADEIDKIGVFMGVGFAQDPSKYRADGTHREYEKTILPGYPPRNIKTAGGILSKEESDKITIAGKSKTVATPTPTTTPVTPTPKPATVKPSGATTVVPPHHEPLALDLTELEEEEAASKKTIKRDKATIELSPDELTPEEDFDFDEGFDAVLNENKNISPRKKNSLMDITHDTFDKLLAAHVKKSLVDPKLYIKI